MKLTSSLIDPPHKIHVTTDIVKRLKNPYVPSMDDMHFRFEKRGYIEVKHLRQIFAYCIISDSNPGTEG
jgi:hypothetical protein